MPSPLHPNLARLAAAYDQIVEDHRCSKISSREARGRISALMGRDDTGLLWAIDPDSGKWCFRNLRGDLVEAEPPRFGIASPKPSDLGPHSKDNFDTRLTFFEVDPASFNIPHADATKHEARLSNSFRWGSGYGVTIVSKGYKSAIQTTLALIATAMREVARYRLPR